MSAPQSLDQLVTERSGASPDAVFLEDARSARVLTYLGLREAVDAWSARFDALGIAPSGAVLVDVADPLSFAVVHLATIASGRRSLPVDPGQPVSELGRLDRLILGASLVVSDHRTVAAAAALPSRSVAGVDRRTLRPFRGVDGPVASATPAPAGEGSAVLFTSGSTGAPKGVEMRESQLLSVARGIAAHNRLTSADRGFNSLPLFHVNAQVVGLLSTLVAGATLVLDARFRRTGFLELLDDRRITWLNAVPAILAVLVKTGAVTFPDRLRFIRSASAPLPEPIRTALGNVPVIVSWGMTEGASQIAAVPLDAPARPGSVGIPVGTEVQARGASGEVLGPNEIGALWIRGAGVIGSYLFGQAAERFDDDGWLCTGDVGFVAADGWVSLVGRSDDVINRGGEKVYPAEVEDVLLADPRALEAVVVPRPDPVLGSVPVAYVIARPGDDVDHDGLHRALVARCEGQLSRFRRPVEIVVVPDLPRAPTGKVKRADVRAMAS